jgi:hypothetical protein
MGLAEVAVSQRADETLRLAMPQNMRYAPIRRLVPSSGLDPRLREGEDDGEEDAAPRGVAREGRAMTASVKKIL